MKAWCSWEEIAAIPGAPKSKLAVHLIASGEGWRHQPRKVRVGGREFLVDDLPPDWRAWLAEKTFNKGRAMREEDVMDIEYLEVKAEELWGLLSEYERRDFGVTAIVSAAASLLMEISDDPDMQDEWSDITCYADERIIELAIAASTKKLVGKTWFTAEKLAGLPGMPDTADGVEAMVERLGLGKKPKRPDEE